MNLLNRDTDYAIKALVKLAAADRIATVGWLAAESGIPRAYLRRILQTLARNKILISQKGKNGGFYLKRPVEKIKVVDLMNIFQKCLTLSECLFKKKICPDRGTCPLRKKILNIESMVMKELGWLTVGSLMK